LWRGLQEVRLRWQQPCLLSHLCTWFDSSRAAAKQHSAQDLEHGGSRHMHNVGSDTCQQAGPSTSTCSLCAACRHLC
jgi:hypothetical protein